MIFPLIHAVSVIANVIAFAIWQQPVSIVGAAFCFLCFLMSLSMASRR